MNIKRISASILFIFLMGIFSSVSAQFQGHIEMKTFNYEKGKIDESLVNMYVTSNRILIKGEDDFNLSKNVSTEGVLIRNDLKDFIIMVGENQALQVTKKEIEDLMDMFLSWGGDSDKGSITDRDPNYRYTDRKRTIMGYECAEMILENEEEDGSYLSVWLTPNIDINWGILAEPWKNLPTDLDEGINVISRDIVFKGKNFPMLIEAVDEDGGVKPVMEVSAINESNIAKAMVQVPSNVALVGAKEFIFKMMMQN